jgi:hypothetical protein
MCVASDGKKRETTMSLGVKAPNLTPAWMEVTEVEERLELLVSDEPEDETPLELEVTEE